MVKSPNLLNKTMVVVIIILFVGIGIQPAIATVEPENIDVEFYDVTTEFIGLGKKHNTKLTKEEIQELDALFDHINERLNKSTSIGESVEIFKEAINELDSFGLFGDIGVKEIEKFVTSYYQNPKFMKILEEVYNKEKKTLSIEQNLFCLIAGRSTGTAFMGLWNFGLFFTISVLFELLFPNFPEDFSFFGFFIGLTFIFLCADIIIPLCVGRQIWFTPDAYGEILTYGLNGRQYWEGHLEGKIECLFLNGSKGAIGFTGLKIQIITYPHSYYLGFTPYVKIEDS